MPESKRGVAAFKAVSAEEFLRANLNKYISGMKRLENGAGLHSLVITMVEKQLLKMTLEETGGNKSQAAHILGLNRNTLRRKIDAYKIKVLK